MKMKYLVAATLTAAAVGLGQSWAHNAYAQTLPAVSTVKQAKTNQKTATKIAKKYVGDYYAYLGADANCWYKLSVRPTQVTYAYVNAAGKAVSVGKVVNNKWVKTTNHGTLWSTKGVKHTQTSVDPKTKKKTTTNYYTNKIGFVDNYNKYGATFNGNATTQVTYTTYKKQLTYLMSFEYYKLGKITVNKKSYQRLNQTILQQIYGVKTTKVAGGMTFVKNARLPRLIGRSYSKKVTAADLVKQRRYTTPKSMRGTWYAYAGKKKWMVIKITARGYESYLLNNKRKSTTYIAAPSVAVKSHLLWVQSHRKAHRTYYTFTPYTSGKNSLGRHFMLRVKVNKKRQQALVVSVKAKQNIVFLKHKPSQNLNFISKKDLAQ